MQIDRRQFCKILAGGLLAGGLGGLLFDARAVSPYGRPRDAYILGHLPRELQPVRINPNLPSGILQQQTFQDFIKYSQAPGLEYVTGKNPVRAAAAGIVHFIGEVRARHNGPQGYYVRVAHDIYDNLQETFYPRVTLYRYQAYRTTYYRLSRVNVRQWQAVQRGQIIGYGQGGGATFKFVLEERGNPVNPDDYGQQHSFMQPIKKDDVKETTREQMNRRLDGQIEIVQAMNAAFKWKKTFKLLKMIHCYTVTEKFYNYPVKWSAVEQFRLLSSLFKKDPAQFTDLSEKQFTGISKKFHDLQPIVLTLPFD